MKLKNPVSVILTCEHATNAVPARFCKMFAGHHDVLASHRGWDTGTLNLGKALKRKLSVPLFATTASRLLVEVNRSIHHQRLFSEFSRGLADKEKTEILAKYYWPYRNAVEQEIRQAIKNGRIVVHLSLHSFTPILDGVERNAEIGLLYDSRRKSEATFCDFLKSCLNKVAPHWRIRRNYPYLGRADGFTTHLRKRFVAKDYLGIELEINQKLMLPAHQKKTIFQLVQAFNELPDGCGCSMNRFSEHIG